MSSPYPICFICKHWSALEEGAEWGQCFLTYQHLGNQVMEGYTMRIVAEGEQSVDRVLETRADHYCNQFAGHEEEEL